MTVDYRELIDLVETWEIRKRTIFQEDPYKDGSNATSLRRFVELQNMLSRKLISEFGKQDPDFYESLVELALNAQRIIEKGKIFVNGSDVTSEGM
jgi:hypothetical protein